MINKKEIIENGKKYSKSNIMEEPYKYFSGRDLQCAGCKNFIVRAAYSTKMTSGYFKTLKGKNHPLYCNWEKSEKFVPKTPVPKLLKRVMRNMRYPKSSHNPGSYHAPASKKTNTFDVKWIKIGKEIVLNVESGFKYQGTINNISKYGDVIYISLFHDGVNENVRLVIPNSSKLPTIVENYYVVIANGLPCNTSSKFNFGIDIKAKDGMYLIEKM